MTTGDIKDHLLTLPPRELADLRCTIMMIEATASAGIANEENMK